MTYQTSQKRYFKGRNFRGRNFRGRNIRGINIRGINIRGRNIRGINIRERIIGEMKIQGFTIANDLFDDNLLELIFANEVKIEEKIPLRTAPLG